MDILAASPVKMATSNAVCVAGTTVTLTSTVRLDFCLNGKAFSRAIFTNQGMVSTTLDAITGVAFTPLAINQGSVYVLLIDSAGVLKAAQGSVETLDGRVSATAKFIRAPQFPTGIPQTLCPFAYVLSFNGSDGAAWTFGTTSWAATNSVQLFVNIMSLPDRPQIT